MKLAGIDCQIPSVCVRNEDVIELVRFHSTSVRATELEEIESAIRKYLTLCGSDSRYWRAKKEKPIDLIKVAVDNALKQAALEINDIDLVIYSSIDRGFIEPANAAYLCKMLGLNNVRNFDIVDACMGWASAVQVADSFLTSSSSINSVLIINSEFPMDEKGLVRPANFNVENVGELSWKSASYTLGEAASACVFHKDSFKCQFEFIEHSNGADLCTILGDSSEKYYTKAQYRPYMQFYADSSALFKNGILPGVTVLNQLLHKLDYSPKLIFPHSVSNKFIQHAKLDIQVQPLIYSTLSKLGNLATASIPSAICRAMQNKLIQKDEKCIAWIASAGMKFAAFEIAF